MEIIQLPLDLATPGLCACGCGQPTPLASKDRPEWGYKKGEHVRYIRGHNAASDPVARFWLRVEKTDACWLWRGGLQSNGYGFISVGHRHVPAHRFSYMLAYGSVPDDLFVCHHCDNPVCVRPDHLFLGTNLDNVRDMWAKGRAVCPEVKRGSTNPRARYTEEQIYEMLRLRFEEHWTLKAISEKYGMTIGAVGMLVIRRSWKHVQYP